MISTRVLVFSIGDSEKQHIESVILPRFIYINNTSRSQASQSRNHYKLLLILHTSHTLKLS